MAFLCTMKIELFIFMFYVSQICVSSQIIGGSINNNLVVWNQTNGQVVKRLTGHTDSVNAVKTISSGLLASASDDKSIKIWNLTNNTLIRTLSWHSGSVNTLDTFQAKNGTKYLASGSDDCNIGIWNLVSYTRVTSILGADDDGVVVVKSLGNSYLASGGYENVIKIWELNTFTFVRRLTGHTSTINVFELLSNGLLASGSADKTIKIWNVNTAVMISNISAPFTAVVNGLKQLNNGLLAITGNSPTMSFWNLSSSSLAQNVNLTSTSSSSRQIIVLDDANTLATANSLGYIEMVDINSFAVFSPPLTSSSDNFLCVEKFTTSQSYASNIVSLSNTTTKTAVIGALDDSTIMFWDASSGQILLTLTGHTDSVLAIKVIDTQTLASGSDDNIVRVWNIALGINVFTLTGHSDGVTCLEYLSNGYLASGSYDSTIRIWNIQNGTLVKKISNANSESVLCLLQISSTLLATGGADNSIYIYNINTYSKVKTLSGHTQNVNSLSLLSSGLLVSASDDYSVRIWNTTSSNSSMKTIISFGSSKLKYARALSNDNLLIGGVNSTLFLWNLTQGSGLVYTWPGLFSSSGSLAALEFNGIIAVSNIYTTVKLIDETTNGFYLAFNTLDSSNQILALDVVQNAIIASKTVTTTTTKLTTTTTTVSTTTLTTTTTITTSSTIATSSAKTRLTTTTIVTSTITSSTKSYVAPYVILPRFDMPYMANNLIETTTKANPDKCDVACKENSICQVYTFNRVNHRCSLYKRLPTDQSQLVSSDFTFLFYKD